MSTPPYLIMKFIKSSISKLSRITTNIKSPSSPNIKPNLKFLEIFKPKLVKLIGHKPYLSILRGFNPLIRN